MTPSDNTPSLSLPKCFNIGEVLCSPDGALVENEMFTADIMNRDAAIGSWFEHASFHETPVIEVRMSTRTGETPNCATLPSVEKSSISSPNNPKPNSASAAKIRRAFSTSGRIRISISPVYRGEPW
jgi:hypothetical protein